VRHWLNRIAVGLAVWGFLVWWARLDDRHPHYLGIGAAVAAAFTIIWLCADAYSVAIPPQWEMYYSRSVGRTFDPRFSRLSQELAEADSREAAAIAVHNNVARVADQILVDKYGIDRSADPDRAAQVLGPEITGYLASDARRERDVFSDRLFDVLARLESL
jgi:hypothetical protein